MRGKYRGPTVGGTCGLVLGLLGLGLDLPDGVVLSIAGVVVFGAALWALCIRALPLLKARLVRWLDVTSQRPFPIHGSAPAAVEEDRAGKLRLAVSQVCEEIEYINGRVVRDDKDYWLKYQLPSAMWEKHSALIATENHELHAALRGAYRVRDAIQHSIDSQATRNILLLRVLPKDRDEWDEVFRTAIAKAEATLDALPQKAR